MLEMWFKTEKLKFIFVFGWILLFTLHHYTAKGKIWFQGPVIMPCSLRADMEVYGRIWYQEVFGLFRKVLCYFTHLHCGITRFLAIGKLFMNKPGDFMDEFGVPIVGRYIDGDRYAVFDVEDILYNVGLVNYSTKIVTKAFIKLSGHMLYLVKSLTKGYLAN